MESNHTAYYKTPLGTAKVIGNNEGIMSISVLDDEMFSTITIPECLQDCVTQLDEYFNGSRKEFHLKLNPQGTGFQKKVWTELLNISFGKSRTYLENQKN